MKKAEEINEKIENREIPKGQGVVFYFNLEQDFESYRNYISEFFLSFAAQAKNQCQFYK